MLIPKIGEKHELNRSAWITYANFSRMYQQVWEELVDSGVVEYRDEPAWVGIDGNVVEDKGAYRCKNEINITDPHWVSVMVMDEIGGNMN